MQAIAPKPNSLHQIVEVNASTNMREDVNFLAKFCNIDTNSCPTVYNIVINGRLPHNTKMTNSKTGRSALHYFLDHQVDRHVMDHVIENLEMMESSMSFYVYDWEGVGKILEFHWGEGRGVLDDFRKSMQGIDEESRAIFAKTSTKVKVTHFGAVQVILSWPIEDAGDGTKKGHLEWTAINTRLVHAKVVMITRLIELMS